MSAVATARLMAERRNWRADHPPMFYARPQSVKMVSIILL